MLQVYRPGIDPSTLHRGEGAAVPINGKDVMTRLAGQAGMTPRPARVVQDSSAASNEG